MCHGFRSLAVHSAERRVLICHCGTLHLLWHTLNFSLRPAEFAGLTALLASTPAPTPVGERLFQEAWHLHVSPSSVGLWYGPMGTTFTAREFGEFRALVGSVMLPLTPAGDHAYALN